jgi:hypothetical protein
MPFNCTYSHIRREEILEFARCECKCIDDQ